MVISWTGGQRILIGFGRVVGALILAYMFVVALMTASAQNGAATRLAKLQPPFDYSTAYALWQEDVTGQRDRIPALRQRKNEITDKLRAKEREERRLSDSFLAKDSLLIPLATSLQKSGACDTVPWPQDFHNSDTVIDLLGATRSCLSQPGIAPERQAAAQTQLEQIGDIVENGQNWAALLPQIQGMKEELQSVQKTMDETNAAHAAAMPMRRCFSEIAVLQNSWIPGGGKLAQLPPPMTQIVLAFISGLFGALLLTLVLIVYPKSGFELASKGEGYGARILLGGLISLCVFVVLGGGTAVLGTSAAFADGSANFLAFCAVGILAGMFSDRVAHWLSERADRFFSAAADERAKREASAPSSVAS